MNSLSSQDENYEANLLRNLPLWVEDDPGHQFLAGSSDGSRRTISCHYLNKKIPRGGNVGGCFEPGLTRWGPCWSFRRFELVDAAHRSKEGSPFVSVDSKRSYQASIPQGNRIKIKYKGNYLKLAINSTLSSRHSQAP